MFMSWWVNLDTSLFTPPVKRWLSWGQKDFFQELARANKGGECKRFNGILFTTMDIKPWRVFIYFSVQRSQFPTVYLLFLSFIGHAGIIMATLVFESAWPST